MRKFYLFGMTALLCASLFVLGGCPTDADDDGGGKPVNLSSSATYDQALAKLDEIIAYCGDDPSRSAVKASAEGYKTGIAASASYWSTFSAATVSGINDLIDTLDDDPGTGTGLPKGIEEDLFGDWTYSTDSSWYYTFSAGSLKQNVLSGEDRSYTITASSWEAVVNTDEATKADYPAGYRLIGTMTAVGEYSLLNPSDDYIGKHSDRIWLLSSDKAQLRRSDWSSDYPFFVRRSAAE